MSCRRPNKYLIERPTIGEVFEEQLFQLQQKVKPERPGPLDGADDKAARRSSFGSYLDFLAKGEWDSGDSEGEEEGEGTTSENAANDDLGPDESRSTLTRGKDAGHAREEEEVMPEEDDEGCVLESELDGGATNSVLLTASKRKHVSSKESGAEGQHERQGANVVEMQKAGAATV